MKKLLFIGVGFYNYDSYILNELKSYYSVSYINSKGFEQKHRFFSYFCIKLGLIKILSYMQNRYINSKIAQVDSSLFDVVFVIKGENLRSSHLAYLKRKSPHAKYVLYLWDSFIRHKNLDEISPYFNNKYSFDSQDCINSDFTLRPLFYFDEAIKEPVLKDVPISFVGGDHTIRYKILKRVKSICKTYYIDYSFHLFIGKVGSLILRYIPFLSKYDADDWDIFSSTPIPYSDYIDLINRSKVVLDVANTDQTGLTMRTIEALRMGARLITTNKYIQDYMDIPTSSYLIIDKNTSDESVVIFIQRKDDVSILPSRYSYKYALKEMIQ